MGILEEHNRQLEAQLLGEAFGGRAAHCTLHTACMNVCAECETESGKDGGCLKTERGKVGGCLKTERDKDGGCLKTERGKDGGCLKTERGKDGGCCNIHSIIASCFLVLWKVVRTVLMEGLYVITHIDRL